MTKQEFRDRHIPALQALCDAHGMWLAWRNRTFSEALADVMVTAIERGASAMSNRAIADLERWVAERLTAAASKHMPAADAWHAMGERQDRQRDEWWANVSEFWLERRGLRHELGGRNCRADRA